MTERTQRLGEQCAWVAGADLLDEARVEALMAEVAIFMDDGPPQTDAENAALMEARCLVTLFLCPLTPTVARYLHGRLLHFGSAA